MPATYRSKHYLRPESEALADAIETGNMAFIKANLNQQNIHTNMLKDSLNHALTPLFYALIVGQVDVISEILKTKLSDTEEKFVSSSRTEYRALGFILFYYGSDDTERDSVQKAILVLLKNNANVLDPSVKRTIASYCYNCKNDNIIQLIENLIQYNELKENKDGVCQKIAELYEKLNEPEEAIRYREGLTSNYLRAGLNQRDGLNGVEKNAYLAIKSFEVAAKEHPEIAHFGYYESFVTRFNLPHPLHIIVQDMKEILDLVLTHYEKLSLEERKNIMVQLFSSVERIGVPTSAELMVRLVALYDKENDNSLLIYFKETLHTIIQKTVPGSEFSNQIQQAYVKCCLRTGLSVEELKLEISKTQDEATLIQLYKRLGESSRGMEAVDAYKKAGFLGDVDSYIAAIRVAEKEEALLGAISSVCDSVLHMLIGSKNTAKILEIEVMIKNIKNTRYIPSDIKSEIERILGVIEKYNEEQKAKELAAQKAAAKLAEDAAHQKFLEEKIAEVNAPVEAERKELEMINSVDVERLKEIIDFNTEILRLLDLGGKSKFRSVKHLAAKKADLYTMTCAHTFYKKNSEGSVYTVSKWIRRAYYLPAIADLLNTYLDSHYARWFRENNVRRNLYLCANAILLGSNTEKAAKRFYMDKDAIISLRERANQYIVEQTVSSGKYHQLADWYKKIIDQVVESGRFVGCSSYVLYQQLIAESASIYNGVLYGTLEIHKEDSMETLVRRIERNLSEMSWLYEGIEAEDEVVSNVLSPLEAVPSFVLPPAFASQSSVVASASAYPAAVNPYSVEHEQNVVIQSSAPAIDLPAQQYAYPQLGVPQNNVSSAVVASSVYPNLFAPQEAVSVLLPQPNAVSIPTQLSSTATALTSLQFQPSAPIAVNTAPTQSVQSAVSSPSAQQVDLLNNSVVIQDDGLFSEFLAQGYAAPSGELDPLFDQAFLDRFNKLSAPAPVLSQQSSVVVVEKPKADVVRQVVFS